MNKNKSRIDIYDTIFDIDIIVANRYVDIEDLRKDYIYSDGVELEDHKDWTASTSTVKNKHTNRHGILIQYHKDSSDKTLDKKLDIFNTAAHEAFHAMLDIYAACGVNISHDDHESHAYFIGWITECILKTWLNR